jgi:hypothetical protein
MGILASRSDTVTIGDIYTRHFDPYLKWSFRPFSGEKMKRFLSIISLVLVFSPAYAGPPNCKGNACEFVEITKTTMDPNTQDVRSMTMKNTGTAKLVVRINWADSFYACAAETKTKLAPGAEGVVERAYPKNYGYCKFKAEFY